MAEFFDLKLEIDSNRGVLWVHSPKGYTVLRICGLPEELAEQVQHACKSSANGMVDITVTESMNTP